MGLLDDLRKEKAARLKEKAELPRDMHTEEVKRHIDNPNSEANTDHMTSREKMQRAMRKAFNSPE